MLAALNLLGEIAAERRVAVLGDMLELGQYEAQAHQMVGVRAAQLADVLITLGPRGHMYAEAARRAGMKADRILEFEEIAAVVDWLQNNLGDTDIALLKGSHGLRMDRIVGELERRS
jgi:UDP-N-acetylmuramoyl-tripeptide--D-alanyl-D-alanine ligase